MLRDRLAIAALGVTLFAPPAGAQRLGSFEAAVLARGTLFDPSLVRETALGVGARAGLYLAPAWLVEADLSNSSANGLASFPRATYRPFHARINFLAPYSDRGKAVFGLGVVANHYGGDFDKNESGLAGLFGLCLDLQHSIIGRADFTLDFVPSPANQAGNVWIAGVQVGLGYRFASGM